MPDQVRVTVLVENTAARPGVQPEHGFSAWVEADGANVLFDTGASDLVCANADALGVDLAKADAVVLSHGHYDHTGGLAAVAERAPGARIFLHPDAEVEPPARDVVLSRRPEIAAPGVWTTGEVPRVTEFETSREPPVPFPDDQALFFETAGGVVVIVGCAHAGVVNTLRHVAALTKRETLHAVFGGMHLRSAPEDRVRRTADAFREFGLERIGPCHCTGDRVIGSFEREFPDAFFRCGTGTVVSFEG